MLVVYSRRSSRMLPTWRSRSCWKSFANIFPLTSSWWRPIPRLWPPGRETICCSCKLKSSSILFLNYNSFFHLAPESTFSAMRVRPQQREPRIADVLQLCLRCALYTQSKIVQEFYLKISRCDTEILWYRKPMRGVHLIANLPLSHLLNWSSPHLPISPSADSSNLKSTILTKYSFEKKSNSPLCS